MALFLIPLGIVAAVASYFFACLLTDPWIAPVLAFCVVLVIVSSVDCYAQDRLRELERMNDPRSGPTPRLSKLRPALRRRLHAADLPTSGG